MVRLTATYNMPGALEISGSGHCFAYIASIYNVLIYKMVRRGAWAGTTTFDNERTDRACATDHQGWIRLMNIRTLCLGILSRGNATGYEIKKMAEEGLFSHFVEASYGSIYPALTRMTDEGLLTCRSEAQDGKPDKKVYSITDAGQKELKSALTIRPKKDKFKSEFLFIMLMSEHLDQDHVSAVLQQRTRELEDELEMIRACGAQVTKPGARFINGYGQAVIGAAYDYVSQNLDFSTTCETSNQTQTLETHLKVDAAE